MSAEKRDSKGASKSSTEEKAEDPNVLGAKLIKAELMGDEDLVKSLKERLERAQKAAAEKKAADTQEKKPTPQGSSHHQRDGQHHHQHHHHHHNQQHHHNRHQQNRSGGGEGGHRERNFDKNRMDPGEANIFNKNYKFNPNDEYDELGPAKEKNKKHKKNDPRSQEDQPKEASTSRQQEKDLKSSNKCELCYENAQKHLIVSMGKFAYLRLPSDESLVEGECMIVPMSHCKSSVTCDEDVLAEIKEFKKALVKMYDAKRMECVFVEQYMDMSYSSHLCIECIPLGMNVSNMGPIYFKKAILESESEWSTNKTIVNLKDQELRKMIPKNMPYFAVNFGITDGYAHVIENAEAFPAHFAKEIIGGILDLDPFLWRRPRREDFTRQSKKVIEFLKWWKNYEFNKK